MSGARSNYSQDQAVLVRWTVYGVKVGFYHVKIHLYTKKRKYYIKKTYDHWYKKQRITHKLSESVILFIVYKKKRERYV